MKNATEPELDKGGPSLEVAESSLCNVLPDTEWVSEKVLGDETLLTLGLSFQPLYFRGIIHQFVSSPKGH